MLSSIFCNLLNISTKYYWRFNVIRIQNSTRAVISGKKIEISHNHNIKYIIGNLIAYDIRIMFQKDRSTMQ